MIIGSPTINMQQNRSQNNSYFSGKLAPISIGGNDDDYDDSPDIKMNLNPKESAKFFAFQELVKNQENYIKELQDKNNELSEYIDNSNKTQQHQFKSSQGQGYIAGEIIELQRELTHAKMKAESSKSNHYEDLNQSQQTSQFISPSKRKLFQNSTLNISQELRTLDRLKQQSTSSWKIEQKRVISHFQSVISKLQHQFQASNQSQRSAQRQLQTAWTNAQKNQSDLQEQIRLLHQQNQELLTSLLDTQKVKPNNQSYPISNSQSSASLIEYQSPKQKSAIKIVPLDDNTIEQLDESFTSPLGGTTTKSNVNESSSKKSTMKLFDEQNYKLQLNQTKRLHSDTVQSYQKQFKMIQKQKKDLEQQIKRMVKTFADKEKMLLKSIEQVRANNNSLIDVANTREKTIQKEITTMKEELESLQEQYDAREMKYIEDAQKYANDIEKYHNLLQNLQNQLDEQIGGKMFELIKEENKKLRAERKEQANIIRQLHIQVNKENSSKVEKFIHQMTKINMQTRRNQKNIQEMQMKQQNEEAFEETRLRTLKKILKNQHDISQMITQSLSILARLGGNLKKSIPNQDQNKHYIQELKQNLSDLKIENSQLHKIKKKHGELKSKNLFSQNQLVQAKKNLITHIAALNSMQPINEQSKDKQKIAGKSEKSIAYLQSICSKLEAENSAILQAKLDMEDLCKKEIANLYQQIHKLEENKIEAQDKIDLLTQNLHHSFNNKQKHPQEQSEQQQEEQEQQTQSQKYSSLLNQILHQITDINSKIAQLCQNDFEQPRIRSHPQPSPVNSKNNLSNSFTTSRLHAPRNLKSNLNHTVVSYSKLNVSKNPPKANFNFKAQIQKIRQEFQKGMQKQFNFLTNQNKYLESYIQEYEAKSDAIESYYTEIISRNNQEFQLLSFAKKELQVQSNEFLTSQSKRASLASTLTRIHKQFKFEALESSTIQILRKEIANLQSRLIFEQQQFEKEIEEMHNIHSEKVMNLSQRESLLKFESQKLRRELQLYEQLSQNKLRSNKQEVNKAKKELNSLRRICNQNQLHSHSHKQKAVDKVEKMQEFYMQKEQASKKLYLEKINKLQQQLNAKNKLVHHVNNILRKQRVERQQELQSQSDKLFDGLRGLSGELAKMRSNADIQSDVDQYSFILNAKGGEFLGMNNNNKSKIAEKNWIIQKKALNAMIDKLKNQIQMMEDQFNSQRSRFKKQIGQLRRTLQDMNKRYEFELSTLRRADDVIMHSQRKGDTLSPIHATLPNANIVFDQKSELQKHQFHETSLDSMMKLIFERDQNGGNSIRRNENKLMSTLQRTGDSSQSFGMPMVLTPTQFKESQDEQDELNSSQKRISYKKKNIQQFSPDSVQKINLKQLYREGQLSSRTNEQDEYFESQNSNRGSNILKQLSQKILSNSFEQSDQDRKMNKKQQQQKKKKKK